MSDIDLALIPSQSKPLPIYGLSNELRRAVLNGVAAENSRRNYALALDELSVFCGERQQPVSRILILEFRAAMLDRELGASTINVKLSAIRKLVEEAKRAGVIGAEEASQMSDIPNVRQNGTRLGNWLTKEQAKELLAIPDRSTLKGKRDYVILALLTACALRRNELAMLDTETIQLREGRWVLADLCGKGRRIRTVAVPTWVKQAINAWMAAAKIENGRLLRRVSKSGRVLGDGLSNWAVWSVVEQAAKQIGIEHFGSHDLRRTCAKLCRKAGGDLEQIKFLLGRSSIQTTERYEPTGKKEQLRSVLIISRHGVRSPLVSAAEYSAQPWPEWEAPPGYLTPHGAEALRQIGTYMRLDLSRKGLFPAAGCPTPADVYLYSDTDERNISSTRATFDAFASGCDLVPVHTVGVDTIDALFRTTNAGFPPPPPGGTAARLAALQAEPKNVFSPESRRQLELLEHILAPDPVHSAKKSIFGSPDQAVSDPADFIAASHPRAIASDIVEDLLLEYADDKPLTDVGWGRVDEATLRKLMPIRIAAFNLEKRTPFFARTASSNITSHILDTLDQAASGLTVSGAFGSPGTRLVYISGHDGDLAGISGLLNLHWTIDGRTGDIPPDAQLIFELWRHVDSKQYTICIRYRAQTLDQLRAASVLSLAKPPAEILLTPLGCKPTESCPFVNFRKTAEMQLDPTYVKPDLTPSRITSAP